MARLSPVLRSLDNAPRKTLIFQCPGCGYTHSIPVEGDKGPVWSWDGDVDKPTFSPSLLVRSGHYCDGTPADECAMCQRVAEKRAAGLDWKSPCGICHSFVRAGRIEYLSDCTHALAGKTVDLPVWETPYGGTDGQ